MKIVHVTFHKLFLGGGERLGYNWVENSSHKSIYYSRSGGIDYTKSKKFKYYDSDEELKAIIEKHRNDVIVCHDPFITKENFFENCKCVIWYVHGAFAFTWDVSRFHKPDLVISNYLPVQKNPSWNTLPIFPVRLGIDPEQFKVPKATPKAKKIICGIVGRISDEKIPLFWFDFAAKFFNDNPDRLDRYEFKFYGKGVEGSEYLYEFNKRVKETPNVEYCGEVDKSEIQTVYQSIDVLVVPSLSETGSYAIVEAQMCGLRVLALNVDGIPNHVTENSHLCLNYDVMFDVLGMMGKRDGIAQRRKQAVSVRKNHSLDTWVKKLDKLAEIAFL